MVKKILDNQIDEVFTINISYKNRKYTFPVWLVNETFNTIDTQYFNTNPYIKIRNDAYNYFLHYDINAAIIFCNKIALNIFSKNELISLCYHEIWHYFENNNIDIHDKDFNLLDNENEIFIADMFAISNSNTETLIAALQKMEVMHTDTKIKQYFQQRIDNIINEK